MCIYYILCVSRWTYLLVIRVVINATQNENLQGIPKTGHWPDYEHCWLC